MKLENINVISNNELAGLRKLDHNKKYAFIYDLKDKTEQELLDFSELSKFLLYIETLKILNAKYDFKNTIIIVYNVNYESDYYKITDYLSAYSIMLNKKSQSIYIGLSDSLINFDEVKITYTDITFDTIDKIYHCAPISVKYDKVLHKIMPLFFIASTKSGEYCDSYIKFSELTNSNNLISSEEFDKIKDKAIKYVSEKDKSIEDVSEKDKLNIFDYTQHTNQLDILKAFVMNNLYRFFTDIKGKKDSGLSSDKKVRHIKSFCNKYKEKFLSESILTQLIICNSLRTLNINKELNNSFDHELFFELSVIEKCYCDSLAYSEGIYQLLENSIFHTRFQILNISMIAYDVRTKPINNEKVFNESRLIKVYEQRKSIYNKFFKDFNSPITSTNYDVDSYAEFIINDSAFTKYGYEGIVDNFNVNHKDKHINNLIELFERELDIDENLSNHYGIQLFEKNILINHGVFKLTSANKLLAGNDYENYTSCLIAGKPIRKILPSDEANKLPLYSTSYDVLFPIKYDWEEVALKTKKSRNGKVKPIKRANCRWLYEKTIITDPNNKSLFSNPAKAISVNELIESQSDITIYNENYEGKNNLIIALSKEIYNHFNGLILPICFDSNISIEIFAKIVLSVIYLKNSNAKSDNLLKNTFIALFFKNDEEIMEFLRIFTIFYDKKGKNKINKDVQVALFLNLPESDKTPKMVSIIAGESIEEIYNTALLYLYSNLDTSDNNIEQCRYITRTVSQEEESYNEIPLFPFDLFLPNYENSYFKKNLKNDIKNNDIRNSDFGIKIENSNVRLCSGVHLEDFFEAEILFHNYDLINKFAFIIASEIEHEIQTKYSINVRKIVIVGYESYSSLLVQEIVRLLKKYHNSAKFVDYCIFTKNDENEDCFIYSPNTSLNDENILNDCIFFTVLPISTTFSTTYRIKNLITKEFVNDANMDSEKLFGGHFSLITVYDPNKKNLYWCDCNYQNPKNNYIRFTEDVELTNERKDQSKTIVSTFLKIETKAHVPICDSNDKDIKFDQERALMNVDKTSTVPNAVFKIFSDQENKNDPNESPYTFFRINGNKNNKRIEALKKCIIYGHIKKRDNHYQYYIEKEKYCYQQQDDIKKWLKKIVLDDNGFNIIVSPLHNPDSIFLKMVLDNCFYHNYRLIHMPIYDTKRDELRSKFSYIAKQFKRIKTYNSSAKINFYFVDSSIVTGRTIARSLSLVRALMTEFDLEAFAPDRYSSIFTIINRSTYNTISKYVENVKEDYNAFVYLYVPHFNTHNNVCPTCDLVEKYKYIEKSSSTNIISNEYIRLSDKHKARSLEEYDKWLEYQILNSRGYYRTLKQWLYKIVVGFQKNDLYKNLLEKDKIKVNILYDEIKKIETNYYLSAALNSNLKENSYNYLTLKDFDKKYQKIGIRLYKEYIYKDKSYLRLITTHKIVEILEKTNGKNHEEQTQNFENELIEYLENEIEGKAKSEQFEITISVIKVASRPLLSQYYHVRQAVLNIITNMLKCILDQGATNACEKIFETLYKDKDSNADIDKDKDNNDIDVSLLKYQLLLCLVRRLTDLHSNYFLIKENFDKLIDKMTEFNNGYLMPCTLNKENLDDFSIFNQFSSPDEIEFTISKIIKWSSMSNDSTSGVFLLCKLFKGDTENND